MKRIHKKATKQDYYGVSCPLNRSKNESFFEGAWLPSQGNARGILMAIKSQNYNAKVDEMYWS